MKRIFINRNDCKTKSAHLQALGVRRLAAAAIIQAWRDAQKTDPLISQAARQWLATDGLEWADVLDLRESLERALQVRFFSV